MVSLEEEFPAAAQCAADLAKIGVEAGYRAGLLAGLREAAEKCDEWVGEAPEADYDNGATADGWQMACRALAKQFRARIAALEEEAGR